MTNKKALKILVYADIYQGSIYQNAAYVEFLSQFGEVIMISSMSNLAYWIDQGDVLCLPGGADVDPMRYNERPLTKHTRINPHYEYLDKVLLSTWLETNKPIIGICRGMQALNVSLGGTLHQHIIGHVGGSNREKCDQLLYTNFHSEDFDFRRHWINSYHHQAVKKLADGFEILGWTNVWKNCKSLSEGPQYPRARNRHEVDKKGDIVLSDSPYYYFPEVIAHKEKPYLAFQYHPEEFNCSLAVMLINKLLGTEVQLKKETNKSKIVKI